MTAERSLRAWSMRDYDAARYGPFLGVSDDGGAAATILRAFLDSPKSRVLARRDELNRRTVGACIDGERLSAAGELIIGPAEYEAIERATRRAVPVTTNVGSVVLPRFYRALPFVTYRATARPDPLKVAARELRALLAPYAAGPRPNPRPATAYVAFRAADRLHTVEKVRILQALAHEIADGRAGDPALHRLGLLQRAHDRGSNAPRVAIDLAARAGLERVLIEGHPRYESQDQLLLPGLLAFFAARRVTAILGYAREQGITIEPKNRIDPDTAARTIWAGLTAARTMGADLGKFGLFPLTFEQQLTVLREVESLIPEWSAAPAFYVDRPCVTAEAVYAERDLVEPIKRWIAAAGSSGASVVLLDAPDRTPRPAGTRRPYHEDRGRRLIKRADSDAVGVLSWPDVDEIRSTAKLQSPAVRVMWAGGLDGRQAFELARRGEFGLFTTSTTARQAAVRAASDPSQATRLEPTYAGVLAVKMVVEAGFLVAVAALRGDASGRRAIESAVAPVLDDLDRGLTAAIGDGETKGLEVLRPLLETAWEAHFASGHGLE